MSLRLSGSRHSMPFGQDDLPILNAEEYLDGPRYRVSRPVAASNRTAAAKSRAQVRHDIGENGIEEPAAKRLRGRPRLDTKDETAADRRRTQIRLAQRAYRHRKDTAITSLEQKLKEMEMVQKSINEEISKLYDMLLTEGIFDLAPHAEPRLRSVADGILRLSSLSPFHDVGPTSGSEEHASRTFGEVNNNASDTSDARNSSSPPSHDSQTSNTSGSGGETMTTFAPVSFDTDYTRNVSGYEVITQATTDNATFPSLFYGQNVELPQSQGASQFRSPMVDLALYPNPPLPGSYAFQERSFSRRLHRFTSERAFILASKPNPHPTRFASVFGFTLLFESREVLVHRLLTVLKRSQDEDLRTWRLASRPLNDGHFNFLEKQFDVSGLNSHYANISPMDSETIGPSNLPTSESEQRIQAMFKSFENHFLFPDDVERLLNRLGIYIPAYTDVVEADIDLDALTRAAQVDQGLHTDDSQTQFRGMNLGPTNSGYDMSNMWIGNPAGDGRYDMSLPGDHASSQVMQIGQMLGNQDGLSSGMASFMGPNYGSTWPPAVGVKTRITIDVPKFIHEATSRAVCLGRAPGVRQRDVIKSLKLAAGIAT